MRKLLLHKVDKKLKRFLIVGTINNIVAYSLYSIFLFCGLHYNIAILIATILSIFFNFYMMGKFVFNNNSNKPILRFIASYISMFLLNISLLYIFNSFNFNMYIAGFITTISIAVISFILNNNFVFKQK